MPVIEATRDSLKREFAEWNDHCVHPENIKVPHPLKPVLDFPEEQIARLRVGSVNAYMSPMADIRTAPLMIKKIRELEMACGRWQDRKFASDILAASAPNFGLIHDIRDDSRPGITVFHISLESLAYLKFTPIHWLVRLMFDESRNDHSYHDADCAIRAIACFRKRAMEWYDANKQICHEENGYMLPRSLFDCCHFLPIRCSPSLADYLFRYRRSKIEYLRMIAGAWNRTGPLSISPKKAFEQIPEKLLADYEAKRPDLAFQAFMAGVDPKPDLTYAQIESRWIASLATPPAFPLDMRIVSDNIIGRFLPRDDPRGIFLGTLTNCCQYPGEAAESCAWHGQESQDGGFFVVEGRKGSVLAQSWAWKATVALKPDSDKCQLRNGDRVACFDSVESKGLTAKLKRAAADIYMRTAQSLVEDHGVKAVVVGEDNHLSLQCLPQFVGEVAVKTPDGVYSDARRRQIVIAAKGPEDGEQVL